MASRSEEENSVHVGRGAQLSGAIRAIGRVVIDGSFEGEIACAHLRVGPDGEVRGDVRIETGDVAGRVDADMSVGHLLSLRATARLDGRCDCAALEIERGAVLNGAVAVTEAVRAPETGFSRIDAARDEELEPLDDAEDIDDLPAPTPDVSAETTAGRRGALRPVRQFPLRASRRSAG